MPLPDPKKYDSESEYVGACMEAQGDEDKPQDQKLAICYSTWRNKDKQKEKTIKKVEEKVDVKKVIKDLAKSYGDSNEDQGKLVNLMKGLAFSDDPAANKFMRALDKWTTEYANKVEESIQADVNIVEIKQDVKVGEVILEKGDYIKIIKEKSWGVEDEGPWSIEIDLRDAQKALDVLDDRKFTTDRGGQVEQTYTNAYKVFDEDVLDEVIELLKEFDIEYTIKKENE